MILFGGRDGFKTPHFANDLWIFDFVEKIWKEVATSDPPSGRYYHNICMEGDTLYSFGGYFWNGNEIYYSDLYSINFGVHSEGNSLEWRCVDRDPIIVPRNRCCFASLKEGTLILYGGNSYKAGVDIFYSDVYLFGTSTNLWCKIPERNVPKRGQASSFVKDGELYVFGGEKDRTRHNDIFALRVLG
eukprot:TRINITY_DN3248_c0_g1_i5.p1 TRINITY_DN3248_c0_g1~~TRINITY_DN3248_c0_g1_i5.p1  ORF type:complete len:187 (+),score=22.87 TRINITY_DN3248_c0_g1_i5:354-914(+)